MTHDHGQKPHDVEVMPIPEIDNLDGFFQIAFHCCRINQEIRVSAAECFTGRKNVLERLLILCTTADGLECVLSNPIERKIDYRHVRCQKSLSTLLVQENAISNDLDLRPKISEPLHEALEILVHSGFETRSHRNVSSTQPW